MQFDKRTYLAFDNNGSVVVKSQICVNIELHLVQKYDVMMKQTIFVHWSNVTLDIILLHFIETCINMSYMYTSVKLFLHL